MKKLTIEITDIDALEARFPTCVETVTRKAVNRSKLRPLVNALYEHGEQVDGVRAYYADEIPAEIADIIVEEVDKALSKISLGELFDHMTVKGDSHD
jgi:hypothetical protein